MPALSFVGRHPDVLASIFALSLAATLGAPLCLEHLLHTSLVYQHTYAMMVPSTGLLHGAAHHIPTVSHAA